MAKSKTKSKIVFLNPFWKEGEEKGKTTRGRRGCACPTKPTTLAIPNIGVVGGTPAP